MNKLTTFTMLFIFIVTLTSFEIQVHISPMTSNAIVQSQSESAPKMDWQKTYSAYFATWIAQTSDGGCVFLVPGEISSLAMAGSQSLNTLTELIKINSAGDVQWVKSFGELVPQNSLVTEGELFPQNMIIAEDGGFAYTTLNNSVLTLCKLDSNGNSIWNKTIEGHYSGSTLLVPTIDGGFAAAIQNTTEQVGKPNFFTSVLVLIKADDEGATQWTKTYAPLSSSFTFRSLIQTNDGGYALAGSFQGSVSGTDFCLVKIDSEGNLQWTKMYGGTKNDDANSLIQTSDGGYALIGNSLSFGTGESDAFLVRTDAAGNVLWARNYNGFGSATGTEYYIFNSTMLYFQVHSMETLSDYANCMLQTKDGGFVFAGTASYDTNPNLYSIIWLVKTDSNGFQEWNQTYPTNFTLEIDYTPNGLIQANDGSFVMAGYSEEFEMAHPETSDRSLIIKTYPEGETTPFPQTTYVPSVPPGFSTYTLKKSSSTYPDWLVASIVVALILAAALAIGVTIRLSQVRKSHNSK